MCSPLRKIITLVLSMGMCFPVIAQDSIYFFQAKSEIEIEKGGKKEHFTAHIRFNVIDTLWISLTGTLGIEGARMLITRDTTYIINKIEGTGYTYLSGEENDWIPFGLTMEDWRLILLQIPYHVDPHFLDSSGNNIEKTYIQSDVSKKLVYQKRQLNHCYFNQLHTAVICDIELGDYERKKDNSEIALRRKITIQSLTEENVQILIKYVDYKFNTPQPFVFNFAKYRNGKN